MAHIEASVSLAEAAQKWAEAIQLLKVMDQRHVQPSLVPRTMCENRSI